MLVQLCTCRHAVRPKVSDGPQVDHWHTQQLLAQFCDALPPACAPDAKGSCMKGEALHTSAFLGKEVCHGLWTHKD